jgi:glycosyltransferase involved in cell wall biosynthesis
VFLFVGGLITRKGIDLLLDAYREAFDCGDEVTLVLKAGGADSFYAHNSLLSRAQKMARDARSARIVVLNDDLTDQKLAALYRAANALVHPYRAEGFCLPLLEAMACGTPVITTDAGPAPEFCPRAESILLPAREVEIAGAPPPLGRLSGALTWFEPEMPALVQALRQAYENSGALAQMGARAAAHVHQHNSWPNLAPVLAARVGSCLQSAAVDSLHQVGA